MFAFSILTLSAGILLGLRFKVLILAPASLGALLVVIGAGVVQADMAWSIGLSAAAAIVCLQIGYLAGNVIRYRLASARARPLPRFSGASAGARPAAEKSRGQSDTESTCREDNSSAFVNEKFFVTSPPSAPFNLPAVTDSAHAAVSHLD